MELRSIVHFVEGASNCILVSSIIRIHEDTLSCAGCRHASSIDVLKRAHQAALYVFKRAYQDVSSSISLLNVVAKSSRKRLFVAVSAFNIVGTRVVWQKKWWNHYRSCTRINCDWEWPFLVPKARVKACVPTQTLTSPVRAYVPTQTLTSPHQSIRTSTNINVASQAKYAFQLKC